MLFLGVTRMLAGVNVVALRFWYCLGVSHSAFIQEGLQEMALLKMLPSLH